MFIAIIMIHLFQGSTLSDDSHVSVLDSIDPIDKELCLHICIYCATVYHAEFNSCFVNLLQDSIPNTYTLECTTDHHMHEGAQTTTLKDKEQSATPSPVTTNHEHDGSEEESHLPETKNYPRGVNRQEEMDEYDYANEEEFWKPASQEKELKMQLSEIPVICGENLQ